MRFLLGCFCGTEYGVFDKVNTGNSGHKVIPRTVFFSCDYVINKYFKKLVYLHCFDTNC